jgi:MFS family permease
VAFVTLLVVSRLVDKLGKRAVPLLILVGVAIAGFILLMATTNRVALVFGATLINAAVYPCIVICAAWVPSNNAGYTKRSTAAAIMQTFIQVFSIISTQIYTTPPRFLKGHGVGLGFLGLCFGAILLVVWLMKRSNGGKDAEAARWRERGEPNPDEAKSLEELCDAHPNYRYVW